MGLVDRILKKMAKKYADQISFGCDNMNISRSPDSVEADYYVHGNDCWFDIGSARFNVKEVKSGANVNSLGLLSSAIKGLRKKSLSEHIKNLL